LEVSGEISLSLLNSSLKFLQCSWVFFDIYVGLFHVVFNEILG
jgi:hypothetical protein